ncbi:MAG: S41 family peptidase [Gammaproteobacteria bacterium]|nr:S41 family peptidase [Gammaproteobacteria bacterium]
MAVASRTLAALAAGTILGFSVSLTGNVLADRSGDLHPAAAPAEALARDDSRLMAEVMERIRTEYVDPLSDHQLMENAVRGMVSALDPHSTFLSSDEYEDMRVSTAGSYPGVGIEVAAADAGIRVLRPIPGSPAARAGILAGDVIVAIDGAALGRGDLEGAIERMRGPAGSTVALAVRRDGTRAPFRFVLRRARVEVHSVTAATLEPGYGYVRISHFSETTPQELEHALAGLEAREPRLRGLVLDLRNNPGGVLEAGVDVSDAFLEEGLIVSADGRTAEARFRMYATPGDLIDGADLVVLVNGGSASASEIVAGALHDHHRAVLVGRTTYGKGSVQTVMPLSLGRAIKLTTSRYFTPSGASIQGKGIVPDVVLEGPEPTPSDFGDQDPGTRLLEQDREVRSALQTLRHMPRRSPVRTAAVRP